MLRLFLVFVAVVAAVLIVHWLIKEDPKKIAAGLKRGALWAAIGIVIFLAVTGRLHWLFAMAAAAVPFLTRILSLLRFVPILSQLYTHVQNARAANTQKMGSGSASGRTSQVQSRFIRMTLVHDTGEMDGEILEGKHRGRFLSELTLAELKPLLSDYRNQDEQSAALLEAYLDRVHEDTWRDAGQSSGSTPSTAPMYEDEAREILGVGKDATTEEIVAAHRSLMQKLHPDRGGSTYLAAKINQAKDFLLGKN